MSQGFRAGYEEEAGAVHAKAESHGRDGRADGQD